MKIGIIGAGVAGLATAFDLINVGHEVTIFESLPFVGGQAATIPVEDTRLEVFYHHLFTNDTAFTDFMADLGMAEQMMWLSSRNDYFFGGKIYPFKGAFDLLRFTPLSFFERLRLGLAVAYLQNRKNWRDFEKTRAVDLLPKLIGKHAYEITLGSQLRGKFGPFREDVSMVWMWCKIRLRVGSRKSLLAKEVLGYPRGSFQTVFEAAADHIRAKGGTILLEHCVEKILTEQAKPGATKVVGLKVQGKTYDFDRVLATVPSYVLPDLLPTLPGTYVEMLNRLKYEAAMVLILKLNNPLSQTYWLNISDPECPFVAVIEQTNFLPPSTYNNKHLVYVSNYLRSSDPLYTLSKEEIIAQYLPHLQKINPQFKLEWIEQSWLFHQDAAQPIITLNYSKGIPSHRTPVEGLYLANTTQIYPEDRGTNYSIRMGRQLAGMMIADEQAKTWACPVNFVAPASEYELTDFVNFAKGKKETGASSTVVATKKPASNLLLVAGVVFLFLSSVIGVLFFKKKQKDAAADLAYLDPNDLNY